ncbi:MAG TPA: M23 family metallopeptidase [Candidatus Limnocylindria bacterium]|nr:M23 family metallopeptidase [Candidatus Limnocylindria bacterium]
MIAGAAFLLFMGMAAPALADDPVPARAIPAPRGLPRSVPSGANYNELIAYAIDSPRDLAALQQQARDVAAQRNATLTEISTLAVLTDRPSIVRDRLEREALVLSARPTTTATALANVSVVEPEFVDQMRALRAQLPQQYDALQTQADALAPFATLQAATTPWHSPAQGRLTQPFGPTSLRLEPARTWGGRYYAHFHEGIDIAAPMYSPVVADAPGRVAFAGHIADGAMVVLIAHLGGLVSLYAHLDDQIAPPRVATGDIVQSGQIIGSIGMTGLTTGPHLHYAVWRDGELIDPLSLFR